MIITLEVISLFILLAGFIIGLGAGTVIDIHGFLGRKSSYWTEATIRTHKVTKPLIWFGTFLTFIGGLLFYKSYPLVGIPLYHLIIWCVLVLNGIFLSFFVSPFLLKREQDGNQKELLSNSLQRKIMISLIISDIGWWGGLLLLVIFLINH